MNTFHRYQWHFDAKMFEHAIITRKHIKKISKTNNKTKTFLLTKKIKKHFLFYLCHI